MSDSAAISYSNFLQQNLQYLNTEQASDPYQHENYQKLLRQKIAQVKKLDEFKQKLREFRRQEMLRIAWRDLTAKADLAGTLRDLSKLADVIVQEALAWLHACLQPKGQRFPSLLVIALGKLGGGFYD